MPDPVVHKHTPYVVILVKMADEWAKNHGGSRPSTREEKKEFKVCTFNYMIHLTFLFNHVLRWLGWLVEHLRN